MAILLAVQDKETIRPRSAFRRRKENHFGGRTYALNHNVIPAPEPGSMRGH
jgi:hypothetical protein